MDRTTAIRTVSLMIPALWATIAIYAVRPSARLRAGLILSFCWNLFTLLVINWIAQHVGWWTFEAKGGTFLGTPVDLLIGWALLWGPLAVLLAMWLSIPVVMLALIIFDLLVMPACAPLVQLGPWWLIGEAAAVVICLVPGLLFARWTENRTQLAARAVLQFFTFLGLFAFLVPAMVYETGFATIPEWSRWDMVWMQLIILLCLPGVSAMQEFVTRGNGTPFPYDPPTRLVVTGPYAYVRNPMQLSNTLFFVGLAILLRSPMMLAGAVISFAYSAGLARWHEEEELVPRWGAVWFGYRAEVRSWIPRWLPWRATPARLYVAASCEICQSVQTWLSSREPIALQFIPAEQHPDRDLLRITYEDGDHEESGIAAIARALEHINLGWAMAGFFIRLPVIRFGLQILCDGAVAPPRRVNRTTHIN